MKLLEAIFILSFVLAACVVGVTNKDNKAFNDYQRVRSYLVVEHPKTGQFCIRGSALILTNNELRAEQYQKRFGKCIKKLVGKYSSTTFL